MDTGQSDKASYAQAVRSPPSSLTEAFSASALPRFVSGKDRNRMRKTPKVSSMQEDKKTKTPDNTVEHLTEHASEEKGSECKQPTATQEEPHINLRGTWSG